MTGYDNCYTHNPAVAEKRARTNRKGGKTGGRGRREGEMAELKAQARELYDAARDGEIAPAKAAVLAQIANLRARLWESERKAADVVTAEQLAAEVREAASIMREHIKDPEVSRAVVTALRARAAAIE
jgi:hypothetical protein